jgi:crossover junction endodeoxyribonuclease RuvC
MSTFIAIDHSLTATGLAVWRDGRVWVRTIRTSKPPEDPHGWGNAPRHRRIASEVIAYVTPDDTVAAIEGRLKYEGHGAADLDLAELRGVIVYRLAAQRVPVASPHLSAIKIYATGKGNASKKDVIAAAREFLDVKVENDNEADALWLLALTLDAYRMPMVKMPARNRAAVVKTTWPIFIPSPTGDGTSKEGTTCQ